MRGLVYYWALIVKRASRALRTITGSTKTLRPMRTLGKYPFCFHELKARMEGRVFGSGKTSSRPVRIPTNCGSLLLCVAAVAWLLVDMCNIMLPRREVSLLPRNLLTAKDLISFSPFVFKGCSPDLAAFTPDNEPQPHAGSLKY